MLTVVILLSLFGCKENDGNIRPGTQNELENLNNEVNNITEIFFNSNQHASLEAVEIQRMDNDIVTIFHYAEKDLSYSGDEIDGEIVVRMDNSNELHLYMNGDYELRIYKVVEDDFQPENIEWTFHKSNNVSDH